MARANNHPPGRDRFEESTRGRGNADPVGLVPRHYNSCEAETWAPSTAALIAIDALQFFDADGTVPPHVGFLDQERV